MMARCGRSIDLRSIDLRPLDFEYRGRFYFDGFAYEGSVDMGSSQKIADRLMVFIHERGVTRQICEYQMKDSELEEH